MDKLLSSPISSKMTTCRLPLALIAMLLFGSLPTLAQVTWDGGGGDLNWETANNWNPNGIPAQTADITIDCSCTVNWDGGVDLRLDGSLTIAAGTTLELNGEKLELGRNDNTAALDNSGVITNTAEIKAKGTGVYGDGPFFTNHGTISAVTKLSAGNNNGGGVVTNSATGIITGVDAHVDGQICNDGIMTFTGNFLLHGGILCGSGELNVDDLEIKPNPTAGAAGAGVGGEIQGGTIVSTSGCSGGADDESGRIYDINGDGPLTWQEVIDTYGESSPDLVADLARISACGEVIGARPVYMRHGKYFQLGRKQPSAFGN